MPEQPELAVSIVDSKTKGAPTAVCRRADGREFWLHSRDNPLEEARLLIQDVPCRERTLYVLLGFGLGYHVKELLQRIPRSSHIVVLEPRSACLSGRLLASGNRNWDWMKNSRLHLFAHHDPRVGPVSLVDRMATLRLLALEMITHQASVPTAEGFYRKLQEAIPREFQVGFNSRIGSLDKMLENHISNFWWNLPCSWSAAPVQSLRGKWSGRKLIIVSAGPSLTRALPILREARGGAMLLATGTAVRTLISRQIQPDLVVSTDPYEANLSHFQGWDTAGIPLVYHHQIYRGIPASYAGPKFCLLMQDDPQVPLKKSQEISNFRQGGSVAFSALQLAHYMDANPIIFIGQDFAFADGHTHADGCIVDRAFNAEALPGDHFRVPGVAGDPVVTSRLYFWYLLYMQEYLLDHARQNPGIRHINTSSTGAIIRGMQPMNLEEALADHGPPGQPSPQPVLATAFAEGRSKPPEPRKKALDRWIAEIERMLPPGKTIADFAALFTRFKATSFYSQAPRLYDDIYYLYETLSRSAGASFPAAFLNRFETHLRAVREELRRIRTGI